MTEEAKKVTIWLSMENYKGLKLLAIQKESTMRALTNEFIKEGLKKYENEQ